MKRFFSNKVRTVLLLAVIVSVVLAVAGRAFDLDLPSMVVKGILTPLRSGLNAMTDSAEQLYSYMFRYEALLAENEELKAKISQMEDDARTAAALRRENERLRSANDMMESRTDFALLDSYIISWDSTDWTSSFTIDRGNAYGIEEGMCVITANGEVVGLVTEVGSNYSVVKSVLDSSLEISANIASSGHSGMVQGGYAVGEEGMLHMNYLPSDAVIRNQDQVVTAGSTMYPRDLILGYVADAGYDETGVAKFAILEPAADFGALEQVFVLTQFNAE